jgi:hypothetical protein
MLVEPAKHHASKRTIPPYSPGAYAFNRLWVEDFVSNLQLNKLTHFEKT